MQPDDNDPKWWVTMIKLIVGATIFIGGLFLALNYAEQMESDAPQAPAKPSWGIVGDSPVR